MVLVGAVIKEKYLLTSVRICVIFKAPNTKIGSFYAGRTRSTKSRERERVKGQIIEVLETNGIVVKVITDSSLDLAKTEENSPELKLAVQLISGARTLAGPYSEFHVSKETGDALEMGSILYLAVAMNKLLEAGKLKGKELDLTPYQQDGIDIVRARMEAGYLIKQFESPTFHQDKILFANWANNQEKPKLGLIARSVGAETL